MTMMTFGAGVGTSPGPTVGFASSIAGNHSVRRSPTWRPPGQSSRRSDAMILPMERSGRIAMILGTLVGATVILGLLVRPFDGGPAASDANSSVLFFDRITSGRTLEAWLNTTPKPLLTFVYGVLHTIDPSWILVSLSAVLAASVAVVISAEVARRIAGLPAAAF